MLVGRLKRGGEINKGGIREGEGGKETCVKNRIDSIMRN